MPKTRYQSERHTGRLREYCIAIKGDFTMQIGSDCYTIKEGEALQFLANCDHCYINDTDEVIKVLVIIYYE